MQPLKPYFLGREKPPHNAAHVVPEVLPHDRHRERRQRRAAPDLLRDARQLLDRRLLQGGRGRVRAGVLDPGLGFDKDAIWITVFAGDDELGLGPDEEAIEAWASLGVPRERIVGLDRDDNFWQAGPTGPCGPCSELYLDRGPEFGGPDDRPGRRHRALPRVLEPRLHAVRPGPRGRADAAADAEHRHGAGARPHGGDPPGRPVGVRDRPVPAADGAGRGAVGPALARPGLPDHAGAAHPRRPFARDDVPDRRRRRALQRGPRLHPAPRACGGRSSRGGCWASSRRSCRRYAEVVTRADGPRLPGADRASATRSTAGWRPRRRASAARSSRARGCSTS